MSDGTVLKPEKDFTKEADKILPEAEALAKVEKTVNRKDRKLTVT